MRNRCFSFFQAIPVVIENTVDGFHVLDLVPRPSKFVQYRLEQIRASGNNVLRIDFVFRVTTEPVFDGNLPRRIRQPVEFDRQYCARLLVAVSRQYISHLR